ncbi:TPA: hypothetical protein ACGW5B_005345 [Bacillus paranthracis]|uniref:hypothetical protein n=1 Tax=Bacillus pacificus TaxID=2026187 RepID=UPI001E2BBC8A|nr:hypothetical protein [Bacillus pacificus]MCC2472094.1 hypothetical protein [Bacillus pacificus]
MNIKPVQMYLGVPQQTKIPVYEVQSNQQSTVKQVILTNTDSEDAKITITVNTVDIMKNLVVAAGETKLLNIEIVLNQNDRLLLQQEKVNAINVIISGVTETLGMMM